VKVRVYRVQVHVRDAETSLPFWKAPRIRIGSSSRWSISRRAASLAGALLVLGAFVVIVSAASRVYRSPEWGFEFAYPDTLVAGRYKDTTTPETEAKMREVGLESPWKHAIALVEPGRLGTRATLDAIPVGQVATVTVTPVRGQKADFFRRQFFRDQWKTMVGGREVYRLPGYPGPYGDAAFYYLMPVRDDLVIELVAHKKHLDGARTDTGYDRVIEGIIASFKIIPPGG
jgi:hypothetical protein